VIIYVLDIEVIQNSSALATAKDIGTTIFIIYHYMNNIEHSVLCKSLVTV